MANQTAKDKVMSLIDFNIESHNKTLAITDLSQDKKLISGSAISVFEKLKSELNSLKESDSLEDIDRKCQQQNQPGIPIHLDDDFLKWSYYCASELINGILFIGMNTWQVMQPEDRLVLNTQKQLLFDFIEELGKIDRSM